MLMVKYTRFWFLDNIYSVMAPSKTADYTFILEMMRVKERA